MNLRKNINLSEVELKFVSGGTKTFSGYASVFGGVDSYNDTIVKGAYTDIIEKIMKGDSRMPKMFVNHRSFDIPIGKWTKVEEDYKGLYMEGELTPGNPQADIIKAGMVHETIDGLSIGFEIGEYEIVKKGDVSLRLIKSIKDLPEVSIVTYPADDNARVDLTSVKSSLDNVKNIRDFENFLRDACGFSKNLATATASRAKTLFTQGDPDVENELPNDLKRLIALNLLSSRSL